MKAKNRRRQVLQWACRKTTLSRYETRAPSKGRYCYMKLRLFPFMLALLKLLSKRCVYCTSIGLTSAPL